MPLSLNKEAVELIEDLCQEKGVSSVTSEHKSLFWLLYRGTTYLGSIKYNQRKKVFEVEPPLSSSPYEVGLRQLEEAFERLCR